MIQIKDNYNNKISFIGETQVFSIKFNRISVKTLSAETREAYLDRSDRLSITVHKISEDEYRTLVEMFYSSGKKTIKTEQNEEYRMIFNMEELGFSFNYDENGEIFYFGVLEMVS